LVILGQIIFSNESVTLKPMDGVIVVVVVVH